MADSIGGSANGHPNLNLTAEEKRVYDQLFKEADPDGFGAISGDVAVKFFERTRLAPDVLGQIWQIADTENLGLLTPAGFNVVLRLIGHVQAGRPPSAQIAAQPAPLPRFDGNAPAPAQQQQQQAPPPIQPPPLTQQLSGYAASPTAGGPPIRVPPLSPDKVAEYSTLFERSGAEQGMLSGVVAKQIFEKARLPNEVLGRIWGLSDTQARGSLDVTEFVIAMHLLASVKSGAMRGVPSTLPPGLYEAASRRPPNRQNTGTPQRPGSAAGFQGGIPPQFSGYSNAGPPQSPISRAQVGTPLSQQSTGDAWAVSPADKARFDQIYATVDKQNLGYITGEQAVQFFGNARLSEETLAQIWDLSDINSEGRLNRDEFAVAMYLIRQQRATRGAIPQSLPANLIPPSMRKQPVAPPATTAPAFGNAPVTQPRSAAEDLFGLDVSEPQAAQPAQPALQAQQQFSQSTGSTDAFRTPSSPITAQTSGAQATGPPSHFRPFVPSSGFGQSLAGTGSGATTQSRAVSGGGDLLDDNEPASTSKITNDAAELGNLSNEVTSLSKETNDLHASRGRIEQDLSQNAGQKRAFQERLTQLRAAYDQEVQQVKTLKEQLAASQADTKKVQQEMAMLEGSHADLQTQHQQLRTALTADQQENASLKEKIRQMNGEVEKLKPQLEKLKSDARQQKGLVAINKKQLATNEAERDRILADISTAQKEHEDAIKEVEESRRQAEEAAQRAEAHQREQQQQAEAHQRALEQARAQPEPKPASAVPAAVMGAAAGAAVAGGAMALSRSPPPTVASPAPSTSSNPFFRRQDSGAVFSPPMGSAIQSPEPVPERHDAFDSIFGPSVGTATEAPSTSFGAPPTDHVIAAAPEAPFVAEPPPPAPADQIESDALPLRQPLERENSVTSSVKVAPPASRLSPANTPRAFTPDTSTESPASHRPDDPFAPAAADEEQESVRRTLPGAEPQERLDVPGAFPDTSRSTTPAQHVDPTTIAVGAGAAAVAAGAGLAAAAVHQEDEKEDTSVPKAKEPAPETNFDDFFGGPAHKKTHSEQLADFDSAFASMGPPPAANGAGARSQEFPDIQELDDDDSDTSDEDRSHGFDDDFAAPKPTQASTVAAGKQPETEPTTSLQPPRPALETASSASSLPPADKGVSPPGYHEAVPEDNPNQFPREYKNLLPEREDPTSPTAAADSSSMPAPTTSSPPPGYGPEVGQATRGANPLSPPPTKAAPFDFDSAFSGMGAAPVEDDSESEYDEFTPGGAQAPPKGNHEFDPSFDSPAASMRTVGTTNTATPATHPQPSALTYDAVTSPVSPAAPTTNGTRAITSPNNDSFNFDSSASSRPISSAPIAAPGPAPAQAISHDWDALFAPLSSTPAISAPSDDHDHSPDTPLRRETTRTLIAPDQAATTTAGEVSGRSTPLPPSMANPQPPKGPSGLSAPPQQASSNKLERPTPGRALSTGTEHDDPILKRLTAMGWSRADSLAALEKFDYNIDKAADYLTFSS